MDRQHRNRLLLWIITLGLANLVAYTFIYGYLGGDAPNGHVQDGHYYLKGHFLWRLEGQSSESVPRTIWLYSFVHSISIYPTIAAILVSMLILARPHIIATMKTDSLVRGHTYIAICITVIVLVTSSATLFFILNFARAISAIESVGSYNT